MAELFSQYSSGTQFTAGTIAGSTLGASGLNPIVDRLNSISSDDGAYSNLGSGTGISINNGSQVALANKTSYYSINGGDFQEYQGSVLHRQSSIESRSTNVGIEHNLNIPHGATVISGIVYGTSTDPTWSINRFHIGSTTGGTSFFSAAVNSPDSASMTIDNNTYKYMVNILGFDSGAAITGVRITYTTDYD